MKKVLLSLIFVAGGLLAMNAQPTDTLITFEAEADTAGWMVFANGSEDAQDSATVVANPDSSEVNPSQMALRFVVADEADQWAGYVLRNAFTGDSAIAITEEEHIFTMQVYRTEVGRVGLKLEDEVAGGEDNPEILVETTLTDEWEVVTFDFSEFIGNTYATLTIFPDFPEEERTAGATVYIDNIMFGMGEATSSPLRPEASLKVYPNPAKDRLYIQHQGMTGYAISNSLGQTIERLKFSPTHQKTINVSKLRAGIHFITVESGDGVQTTRFIKD